MGGKRTLDRLISSGMRHLPSFIAAAVALADPAQAQSDLEKGLAGAIRGCEEWVLNPASWADGPQPFIATVGLGNTIGLVSTVEEVNLPPKQLRKGNHYWRINSTLGAGYVLVVSDQLPMCHITGGGNTDLQPVVETVLASTDFKARWEQLETSSKGDMVSTDFRNRQDPAMTIAISRANRPNQRLDKVQVLATATYK
jgi:hypothetical protein